MNNLNKCLSRLGFFLRVQSLGFKSQSGFSMVEILVGVGLVGISGLALMKLSENTNKSQVTSEIKMEVLEVERLITSAMLDKSTCLINLDGKKIGESLTQIKTAAGGVLYETNKSTNVRSTQIESISISYKTALTASTSLIDLEVRLKKMKSGYSQPRLIRIPINVKVDSGKITDCFTDKDLMAQQICVSLGGVFNGVNCKLPGCPAGTVMKSLGANGTPECEASIIGKGCSPGSFLKGYSNTGSPQCDTPVTVVNDTPVIAPVTVVNDSPPPAKAKAKDCPSEYVTWSGQKDSGCSGFLFAGKNNSTQKVIDDARSGNTEGDATFECRDGNWAPQSGGFCINGCQLSELAFAGCISGESGVTSVSNAKVCPNYIIGPPNASGCGRCVAPGKWEPIDWKCGVNSQLPK